jgi:hypothetical protein
MHRRLIQYAHTLTIKDRCESLCKLENSGFHAIKLPIPIELAIGACMPPPQIKWRLAIHSLYRGLHAA